MSLEGITKYSKCVADCPRVCKNKTSGISSYFYYGGKRSKRCWKGGKRSRRCWKGGSAFNPDLANASPFDDPNSASANAMVNGPDVNLVQQAGRRSRRRRYRGGSCCNQTLRGGRRRRRNRRHHW